MIFLIWALPADGGSGFTFQSFLLRQKANQKRIFTAIPNAFRINNEELKSGNRKDKSKSFLERCEASKFVEKIELPSASLT